MGCAECYQNETKHLFGVLDGQLQDSEFLAGGFSIADIASWSWVRVHKMAGIDIEVFPNLKCWLDHHKFLLKMAAIGRKPT